MMCRPASSTTLTELASEFATLRPLPATDTDTTNNELTLRHQLSSQQRQAEPLVAASHHENQARPLPVPGHAGQGGCKGFRTHTAGHKKHNLQPAIMWPSAILGARWVLVCHGTPRHRAARHGTGTGKVADEAVQTDTESTNLIAMQRTLNLRVRGSSPWWRTRFELGTLDVIESAQRPFRGGFRAMGARWVLGGCSDVVILSPGAHRHTARIPNCAHALH